MHEYAVYRIDAEHKAPETAQALEQLGLFAGERVAGLNTARQARETARQYYETGDRRFTYVARKESTGRILLRLDARS